MTRLNSQGVSKDCKYFFFMNQGYMFCQIKVSNAAKGNSFKNLKLNFGVWGLPVHYEINLSSNFPGFDPKSRQSHESVLGYCHNHGI